VISLVPGIHLRELQRILGISFNSTRYHVDYLSHAGEIERVDQGGFSRLYPCGINEQHRTLFAALRNKTKRMILSTLARGTGLTNRQLADITGLSKSTISEHLKSLKEDEVVQTELSTHLGVVYVLRNPQEVSKLLVASEETMLRKATQRFVELWDF
jgi:predicted transcriptional regulator